MLQGWWKGTVIEEVGQGLGLYGNGFLLRNKCQLKIKTRNRNRIIYTQ